ncbi:MAG: nucleotidyltransferase family protein [Candidatus Obscuribacterales bacterium]|nr:nucleotidyltransferase family protein [Candidatus Obscuribacterales bacterium]
MDKAVILAGGQGQRLRPLTSDRPKCMVEVLGTPLMAFQLHWLRSNGIKEVVIACGYHWKSIEDFFGNGSKMGLSIRYAVEEEPLGRGGALKAALQILNLQKNEFAFAVNGDILSNLKLNELAEFHKQSGVLCTVVTVPLQSPYGIVEIDTNSKIIAFREKPVLPYKVNAGMYAFDSAALSLLPDKGDHEETTFPTLAKEGKLAALQKDIFWKPVDTVKDLGELKIELEKFLLQSFFAG